MSEENDLGLDGQTEGSQTIESKSDSGSHASPKNDDYLYTQKDLDSREIKLKKKFETKMERMREELLEDLKLQGASEIDKAKSQIDKLAKENAILQEQNKSFHVKQKQFEVQTIASKLNAVDPEVVWLSVKDDVLKDEDFNIEKSIAGLLKSKPYLVRPTMPQGGAGSKASNAAPQSDKVNMTIAANRIAALKNLGGQNNS